MNDRHNAITGVGAAGLSMISGIASFFYPIRYVIIVLFLLIMLDLYFGLRESRYKHVQIRLSRAMRRTGNKIMDYFFFILVAGFIQQVFDESKITFPYFSIVSISVFGVFEIESVINHWLVLHGRKEVDFSKFLKIVVKKNDTLKDVAEEYEKQQQENKDNKEDKENGEN